VARELGEVDDVLFGRAQYAVRRALLAEARRCALHDVDAVFFAPLADTIEHARRGTCPEPDTVRELAEQGRRTWRGQRDAAMPLAFQNGRALAGERTRQLDNCWQGRGMGGRVEGTVVRATDLVIATEVPEDAVLVAPTVTPGMTLLLLGVACVVTEHGGLLDHGAALARELGVPCVVGCTGVWAHLETGDRVWVDGQAGVVARIPPRP
jgi:pyruvate,water dikinase